MKPRFALTIGALRSTSDDPVGLPERIVVERDLDTPADALRVRLGQDIKVAPGDRVALSLGYQGTDPVFAGTVTVVRPTLTGSEVCALGAMLGLLGLRVAAAYQRRTAGDIVRDLAGRAGLDLGTVDPGAVLPAYAVDRAVSAYTHVRTLADRFGFELYTDREGRLMCHDPRPGVALSYTYGRDLLAASGTLRMAGPAAEVGGESPASQRGESAAHWLSTDDLTGRPAGGGAATLVLDAAARTQDLADRFAAGRAAVERRGRRLMQLRVLGRATAELGERCGAGGALPSGLAGSGYVRALRHEMAPGTGWVTDLSIAAADESGPFGGLL